MGEAIKKMRAAIYNPYFDTLGGGERYTLAFASALQKSGYDVFVEWKSPSIKETLEARFGIDLSNIAFVKNLKRGEGFDLCFWVSDGSIPLLRARKNYIHFQIPFMNVDGRSLMNRMKMFRVNKVICNSEFTKKSVDKEYGVNSTVLYPPVDTQHLKPKIKQNIILAVGRFSQLTQAKNQHILVEVFKKMLSKGLKDWKLILTGGSEIGGADYIRKLRKTANGKFFEIIENPSYEKIKELYGTSKIFWTASGYGIEESREPKRVEHFGITMVEAMTAGSVPLAFNAGGHKEIIDDHTNGLLWNTKGELAKLTLNLIQDSKCLKLMANEARIKAQKFSYEEFTNKVQQIIK